MLDQTDGFDWQVEDSPVHVHDERCYRKVLDWIESNGIRDGHGGYRVLDNITMFSMKGVLYPLRSGPGECFDGQIVSRAYVPKVGTPAFHAWICVKASTRSGSRIDPASGVELSETYFPAEAMRHLRLAAGVSVPVSERSANATPGDARAAATRKPELPPPKPKCAGGRPTLSEREAQKRKKLIEQWRRARAEGVPQKDFCTDKDVSLRDLSRYVNWLSQRRRRSNKP